jgi:hypothetical protein
MTHQEEKGAIEHAIRYLEQAVDRWRKQAIDRFTDSAVGLIAFAGSK